MIFPQFPNPIFHRCRHDKDIATTRNVNAMTTTIEAPPNSGNPPIVALVIETTCADNPSTLAAASDLIVISLISSSLCRMYEYKSKKNPESTTPGIAATYGRRSVNCMSQPEVK
jgi:hypothetical protein